MATRRRRKRERESQYDSPTYHKLLGRLGRGVKRLRRGHEWTQQEAAEQCGMPIRLFQQIENEGSNVTLTTLARLCEGFQVDIVQLVEAPRKKPRPLR